MKEVLNKLVILLIVLASMPAFGQTNYAYKTFDDTRIINGHSVETERKGNLCFIISHRFGDLNGGAYQLWGLDQSTIRLGFDYGINDQMTIGIGRSSFEKTYDAYYKWRFLYQKSGDQNSPITAVFLASAALKTQEWPNPDRENFFTSRLYYTYQLLLARKFSNRFSLQLMPSVVHRNLVATSDEAHDVIALGIAPKFRISKVIALQAEYYWVPDGQLASGFRNSFAIGCSINTKGHVFQFQLSNSRGMIEKFFITETQGNWFDGSIGLGFNITRDFKVKGREY